MKRRVVVIGAGLAGLRAGWELANAGAAVTVLERKAAAGGRAGSAPDHETGEPVDTGQHAFMGCYTESRKWFDALGTAEKLWFDDRLRARYLADGAADRKFAASSMPAPLHLLVAVSMLDGGLSAFFPLAKALGTHASVDQLTVVQWENKLGLSDEIRRLLIEPLALAALNEDPAVASAAPLVKAMRIIAHSNAAGSALGFATCGLADLYVPAATRAIEAAGGAVRTGTWAARLNVTNGRATGVTLQDGQTLDADSVISALPPSDLVSLLQNVPALGELASASAKWQYSPILTVHVWLDRRILSDRFVGLFDASFDWVFNRTKILGIEGSGQHLALVKSGARSLLGRKPDDLGELAIAELRRFIPDSAGAQVIRTRSVWETKATVSLIPGSDALRPGAITPVKGFLLAGDWTQTGLPATIESAVVSGKTAANIVISSLA